MQLQLRTGPARLWGARTEGMVLQANQHIIKRYSFSGWVELDFSKALTILYGKPDLQLTVNYPRYGGGKPFSTQKLFTSPAEL